MVWIVRPGARLDLLELELLLSVADTGSLGQAANRHSISQPAVSGRMTNLERALGLRLLRRDPSGTRLTPDGNEIAAAAHEVLRAADRLSGVAERLRNASDKRLRVAASFTVAEHLALAWLTALRSQMPGVTLALEVLNSSQVAAAVDRGAVDIGFVEGTDEVAASMGSEVVANDSLVVVTSPEHPWARAGSTTGVELAATELVVREVGSGTREVLERALRPWGGVTSRLELGSNAMVLDAARRSEAPAVLGTLAAAADLAAGTLRRVEVADVDLSREIRAVWSAGEAPPPLAVRLLAAAQDFGGTSPPRSSSAR